MSKTIKELADELGVTKTAIRKYMTDDFRQNYVETDATGVLHINDEGANFLQKLRKLPQTPQTKFAETDENSGLQYVIDTQKETIEVLKAQLAAKDEQIRAQQEQLSLKEEQIGQLTVALQQQTTALENTTTALAAAQALHAADKKQLLAIEDKSMSWLERRRAKKAAKKAQKDTE